MSSSRKGVRRGGRSHRGGRPDVTLVIAFPVLRAPSERIFDGDRRAALRPALGHVAVRWSGGLDINSQPSLTSPVSLALPGPVAAYNWLVAPFHSRGGCISASPGLAAGATVARSPTRSPRSMWPTPPITTSQTQWVPLHWLALWRGSTMPAGALAFAPRRW